MTFRDEDVPAVLAFARHQAKRMRAARRELDGALRRALVQGARALTVDGVWWFAPREAARELRRLARAIAFYDRAVATADQFPDPDARAIMLSAVWFGRTN
ncbi:MAG: hypothetical protein MUF34_37490 [Polyangiaceae bacterium]|jgi:hypothetical protein|nr:hypothetical protein [Polyangiaceae bacterium]